MCKYCNPEREYLDEDEYVNSLLSHRELKNDVYEGLEIGIDKDKLSIFAVIPLKVGFSTFHASYTKNLDIKYCPMCGRRLDGKVDLDRMTASENRAYKDTICDTCEYFDECTYNRMEITNIEEAKRHYVPEFGVKCKKMRELQVP